MRVRGENGGLYPVLSTAAARWRLAGESERVARQGRLQREGNGRWRRSGATRGRQHEVGGDSGAALHGGVGAAQRRRETEQASRQEEGKKDRFAISEISGT